MPSQCLTCADDGWFGLKDENISEILNRFQPNVVTLGKCRGGMVV